jgi:ATP-dependent Clp protease ATP-binding subunit ClpB
LIHEIALSDEEKRTRTMDLLRSTFRPEFLNRIDDIVTFRSLTTHDIDRIIDIQIDLIQKRLKERKLILELTENAKKYIAKTGYSPVYGARPLKRALQKLLLDNLSLKLLDGTFTEGNHILVDATDSGEMIFEKR